MDADCAGNCHDRKDVIQGKPLVSVIMPLYNAERFVAEAIESILHQTYENLELIIVDDFSQDGSVDIVRNFASSDARIRLFHNDRNLGVAKTRNRAIREARGEYIACLDNDDVALPSRFEEQLRFLETHPDHALVASDLEIIDEYSRVVAVRVYPHSDGEIQCCLSRMNPIANPASMFRRSVFLELGGAYDESVCPVEDYEFVIRVARRFKIANLEQKLTRYRITATQAKAVQLKKTLGTTLLIQRRALASGLSDSFYNRMYRGALRVLLYFPNRFVMLLFKKVSFG